MQPQAGGRVVLELEETGAEIVYAAALYTPDAIHTGRARIAADDGAIRWDEWAPATPPAWLVEMAHAFLRSEWRARRPGLEDPEPWPRRINRWREAK